MLDLSTPFWKSWEKVVLKGWRHPRSHLCHRCLQPLKTTFSKSVWKCSRGVLKLSKPLFKVFTPFWTTLGKVGKKLLSEVEDTPEVTFFIDVFSLWKWLFPKVFKIVRKCSRGVLKWSKPLFNVFLPFWTTLEHFWKSWEKVVFRGWRHPWSHLCYICLKPLKMTFSKSVQKCSRGVLQWSKSTFQVF